jgi:hypothetical protein
LCRLVYVEAGDEEVLAPVFDNENGKDARERDEVEYELRTTGKTAQRQSQRRKGTVRKS